MLSAQDLLLMKSRGEKIAIATAYDAAFAAMAEAAGIDQILVGDSLANTMLGLKHTSEIGMKEMEIFTAAVCRGAPNTHVIADMPYQSDEIPELALENAKKLLDCGASSVKIEGAKVDTIRFLRENGVEVMGHLGLLPQTAQNFKQCGKTDEEANRICQDAKILESLGVYAFVLEHIPSELGKKITDAATPVTIGIGAGQATDGQVLVMHDFLGMHQRKLPPFAHKFANLFEAGIEGFERYIDSVKNCV